MKDIDFDELDKAVSSLMGTVTGMPEPAKQDDVRTLTISETIKDDKAPVLPVGEVKADGTVEVTVKAPVKSEPEAPKPAAPTPSREATTIPTLAARRSGRFMDMVHPASAMKPAEARSISRQGVTLAPLESVVVPETVVAAPDTPPAVVAPHAADEVEVVVEATETPVEVNIESSPWPDPIDLHEAATGASESEDDVVADAATDEDETVSTAPLVSPFLTDAKVEKRPLGAPATTGPSEATTPLAFDTEPSTEPAPAPVVVAEEPASTSRQEVTLPEEFQNDLIAIEADQSVGASVPVAAQAAPVVSPTPAVRPGTFPSMAAAAASAAGGSIPQQYQEQPSSGDQTTGAIYDTAAYHQPLDHPAKKQASWLWVVWVAGLLILGAGGGALVYHLLLK